MLDQAIYVTTTNRRSAPITENGDLYTWGDNTYGQCGYTGEATFLTEPEKVMENVRMVWCDEIEQNAIWTDLANVNPNDYGTIRYDDTFVLTKDGKMYAAGTNIGTDSGRNTPYGEGEDDERSDENKCTTYSAKFLPIEVKEYVPESNPTEEYTGEKKIQIEGTIAARLAGWDGMCEEIFFGFFGVFFGKEFGGFFFQSRMEKQGEGGGAGRDIVDF